MSFLGIKSLSWSSLKSWWKIRWHRVSLRGQRHSCYVMQQLQGFDWLHFITVDKTLRIQNYSQGLLSQDQERCLLGHDMITDFFALGLNEQEQIQLRADLSAVLGMGALQWKLSEGRLPHKLSLSLPGAQNCEKRLRYIPHWDKRKKLMALTIVIDDVTAFSGAMDALKAHKQELERIFAVLKISEPMYEYFINDSKSKISQLKDLIVGLQKQRMSLSQGQIEVSRLLHSFKGHAALFGFKAISQAIHEVESRLVHIEGSEYVGQLHDGLLLLSDALYGYASLRKELLSIDERQGYERLLPELRLESMRIYLQLALDKHLADDVSLKSIWQEFSQLFDMKNKPSLRLFAPYYDAMITEIAAQEGKRLYPIRWHGIDTALEPSALKIVHEILLQLLRNTLAHGIESLGERTQQGKDPIGTLQVRCDYHGSLVRLEFRDDGQGMDAEAVAKRAVALGLCTSEDVLEMSDAKKYQLILEQGYTSLSEAREIAGRGVGLEAVRGWVDDLGGEITIESVSGVGTCFVMEWPRFEGQPVVQNDLLEVLVEPNTKPKISQHSFAKHFSGVMIKTDWQRGVKLVQRFVILSPESLERYYTSPYYHATDKLFVDGYPGEALLRAWRDQGVEVWVLPFVLSEGCSQEFWSMVVAYLKQGGREQSGGLVAG